MGGDNKGAWFKGATNKKMEEEALQEWARDYYDDDDEQDPSLIPACGGNQFLPPEKALIPANILAGMVAGIKLTLGMVVFSSLVFSQDEYPALEDALPIAMNAFLATAAFQVLWFGLFGTMRFALVTPQDIPAIVFAEIAIIVAEEHKDETDKVLPTVFALMALVAMISGVIFIAMGKFKLTRFLLLIPFPVTGGFLGSVGYSACKGAFGLMSGAKFYYAWPKDADAWSNFVKPEAISRMVAGITLVIAIRNLPAILKKRTENKILASMWSPIVMLVPVIVFWITAVAAGISVKELQDTGWLYGDQEASPFYSYITYAYDFGKFDAGCFYNVDILINMGVLIFLTVLSAAITLSGFELECGSDEALSKDVEMTQLGYACVASGFAAGQVGYHQLGTSINNRIDGGTHRISLFTAGLFIAGIWVSGAPISSYVPKWFLGGIYLNIGIVFLKKWVWESYFKLPFSEYLCIWIAILGTVFTTKIYYGVIIGLVFALILFVLKMASLDPFRSAQYGDSMRSVVTRTPDEEDMLKTWGRSILVFKLQGPLFFGSVDLLFQTIESNLASEISNRAQAQRESQNSPLLKTQESAKDVRVQFVIVDFNGVSTMDSSAAEQFKKMVGSCHTAGIHFMFSGLKTETESDLEREGVFEGFDHEHACKAVHETLERALEWCENSLLDVHCYAGGGMEGAQDRMTDRLHFGSDPETAVELLRSVGLQRSELEMEHLAKQFELREYSLGERVYKAGDLPEKLCLIWKGIVETVDDGDVGSAPVLNARVRTDISKLLVEKLSPTDSCLNTSLHTKPKRLHKEGSGSMVGEAQFMGLYRHSHDKVVRSAPCVVLEISREKIEMLREQEPPTYGAFLELVLGQLASDVKSLNKLHVATVNETAVGQHKDVTALATEGRRRLAVQPNAADNSAYAIA